MVTTKSHYEFDSKEAIPWHGVYRWRAFRRANAVHWTALGTTDCCTKAVWRGDEGALQGSWDVPTVMVWCRARAGAHRAESPSKLLG